MIRKIREVILNEEKLGEDVTDAGSKATKYISSITGTDGISVHNVNDTSNYVNITSGLINLVTGGTSRLKAYVENNVAKLRVGDTSSGHIMIEPNSIDMITGGVSRLKAYIENNIAKLRIGNAAAGHIVIDPDSVDIKDGNDELASFDANGAQLGKNNPYAEIAFNDRHGILYGKDYVGYQYGLELGIPDADWANSYDTLITRIFTEKIPDNERETTAYFDLSARDDDASFSLFCQARHYESTTTPDPEDEGSSEEEVPTVSPTIYGHIEQAGNVGRTFVGNQAMTYSTFEDSGMEVVTEIRNSGQAYYSSIEFSGNIMKFNGGTIHSSDKRLKEHIEYIGDEAAEFIRSLKPARFKLKGEESAGFYAQEVEEVDPYGCFVSDDDKGYKSLNYIGLIAPLVAYCQSLEERIRKLEEK